MRSHPCFQPHLIPGRSAGAQTKAECLSLCDLAFMRAMRPLLGPLWLRVTVVPPRVNHLAEWWWIPVAASRLVGRTPRVWVIICAIACTCRCHVGGVHVWPAMGRMRVWIANDAAVDSGIGWLGRRRWRRMVLWSRNVTRRCAMDPRLMPGEVPHGSLLLVAIWRIECRLCQRWDATLRLEQPLHGAHLTHPAPSSFFSETSQRNVEESKLTNVF